MVIASNSIKTSNLSLITVINERLCRANTRVMFHINNSRENIFYISSLFPHQKEVYWILKNM